MRGEQESVIECILLSCTYNGAQGQQHNNESALEWRVHESNRECIRVHESHQRVHQSIRLQSASKFALILECFMLLTVEL